MAKNTIADLDTVAANNLDVLNQSTAGSASANTIDTIFQNTLGLLARFYADIGGDVTVGGTADAVTITSASTYQALEDGLIIAFKAGADNTGAATLNLDSLGVKAIRKQGDDDLSAGDMIEDGVYLLRYDEAYNSAAGAWVLLNPANPGAASTTAAGIVELATPTEAITGMSTSLAVTPAGLYYPAGHLYGLTLSNGTDATNDIDIAPGTARNHLDTANMDLITGLTKQMDASWAVGDDAGGCFGTASDTTWHVYLIKRPDTGVVDVGFSTDASDPTGDANYPADYTIYRRIGYFVRASGVNGEPVMLAKPEVQMAGTAPVFACRAWVNFDGTGTVAIRGSGNVSSITDNGAGDYTINFTEAMPDANYAIVGSAGSTDMRHGHVLVYSATDPTTTAVRVWVGNTGDNVKADYPIVSVAIFR